MKLKKKLAAAAVSGMMLATCLSSAAPVVQTSLSAAAADDNNDDWLHAEGSKLYDANGNQVWLTGANWFGFNCTENCAHGLYATDIDAFLKTVGDHGINLIRMPISTELLVSWMRGTPDPVSSVNAGYEPPTDQVGEDGTVIVCGEDPHLVELAKSTGRHVLSYGFAESNDIVCMHPDVKGIQSDFIVRFEDGTEHAVEIKSNPGRHNMLNATAVLTVAHVLGLDIDAAAKALSSFEGVRRRFTHVGDIDGITVVDDYGHHPTEIKATLAAASSLGYKHVDVVFQPHRYSRLQALCDDFADAFANADKLLLIDVFSAGEMPIPGVTSKMLAETVRAKHPGKEVVYCSSRLELNQELEQMVGEGDLLLTMGAGDVTTVGPEFIEYLTAKKDA